MGHEDGTVARRARGGGRDGRQSGRAQARAPAYITRRIPTYEFLGEDALVSVSRRTPT